MESEGDDLELTREELHRWITEEVKRSELVDLSAENMCHLLLEKMRKRKAGFDRLTQSVADLEVVIQQLYSLLGWEYREEDSDDGGELRCTLPAEALNAAVEASVSRDGEDADADGRPLECDLKPKLKRRAVPLEATSTRLEPDCSSARLRGSRPRPYCSTQRSGPGSAEPSSASASRRRPVVLLRRLPVREIHSALRPESPTPHAAGGPRGDVHRGCDCGNGVVDTDVDSDADDVIDIHRGATTGCDTDSLSEDPRRGTASARSVETKALSQISAKASKAKMRSKSVKVQGQNGDALMTAEPQGCGAFSSSVSHPYALNPSTFPEQQITLYMKVLARSRNRKWLPGAIVEIFPKEGCGESLKYKVLLEEHGRVLVSGHHLAFGTAPEPEGLCVGARVVTQHQGDGPPSFLSGVLGELPSNRNSMRFLVFFDDHTPSYVPLPSLHLVCQPLAEPWADIPDGAHQRFIREYLRAWPHPPMALYRVGQRLNVDCQGVQRAGKVLQTDWSLIQVLFQHSGNKEWIHRASMRLEHPVGVERVLQKGETRAAEPSVAAMVSHAPHLCSPACLEGVLRHGPAEGSRKRNPLLVPMLHKFRRVMEHPRPDPSPTRTPEPHAVYYCAPCGLPLTTIARVEEYLDVTRCDFLSVDAFSLDPLVSVARARPLPFQVFIPDLTGGGEDKVVSLLNEHSHRLPARLTYRKCRDASRVRLDASPGFVAGCDCQDGCRDSGSCSCRQLSIHSTAGGGVGKNVGYAQKRLSSPVVTGVYECNAQCPCDPRTCSNRVVQHGIQARLQVFKTQDTGWGVRCLDDLPGGAFVCSYSGRVVPAYEKNQTSTALCAELNHIEEVELHKEGYENEAYCSEPDDCSGRSKELQQNGGPSVGIANNQTSQQTKAKDPTFQRKKHASPTVPITTSRCFFDGEDHGYVIDAHMEGNVARYLNHSHSPNLFKQFVFVDTHDLRFPWLTFFTKRRVKAGTELTWDDRSVRKEDAETPGQERYCGSKTCSEIDVHRVL